MSIGSPGKPGACSKKSLETNQPAQARRSPLWHLFAIVGPHPQDMHNPLVLNYLVDKPMLDIDSSGKTSLKIAR